MDLTTLIKDVGFPIALVILLEIRNKQLTDRLFDVIEKTNVVMTQVATALDHLANKN